jgi:hypothetical protein
MAHQNEALRLCGIRFSQKAGKVDFTTQVQSGATGKISSFKAFGW